MSDATPSPQRTNPLAGFFKIEGTAIALVLALLILVFIFTAPRAFMGFRVYMSFMATVLWRSFFVGRPITNRFGFIDVKAEKRSPSTSCAPPSAFAASALMWIRR